jgi:hypothetical protein
VGDPVCCVWVVEIGAYDYMFCCLEWSYIALRCVGCERGDCCWCQAGDGGIRVGACGCGGWGVCNGR